MADPELKRKIIGRTFIEVFEKSLRSIGHTDYLAQGTLYPDVIESVAIGNNPAALIKSHHNVGGLPARMKLQLIEPLRELFKDEVRAVGARLGLPRAVVWRQPFPGPGLGVRVLGAITPRPARRPAPGRRHPAGGNAALAAGIGRSGSRSACSCR